MDSHLLLGIAAPAVGTVVWWMFRSLYVRMGEAERALAEFKLHCAETYVTSGELGKSIDALNETIRAIFSKLDRIEDKLDTKLDVAVFYAKADKP